MIKEVYKTLSQNVFDPHQCINKFFLFQFKKIARAHKIALSILKYTVTGISIAGIYFILFPEFSLGLAAIYRIIFSILIGIIVPCRISIFFKKITVTLCLPN